MERNKIDPLIRDLLHLGVYVSKRDAQKLIFLAERKYNRYDLYAAGETFQSRLLRWLQNFEKIDRETAFGVVLALTYVSQPEAKSIVVSTFNNITNKVLQELKELPRDSAHSYLDVRNQKLENELSKSIFIAAADDVHFDYFRRYAQREFKLLNRDNFVEYYKFHEFAQKEVIEHNRIFLLDQIAASGTTAIRHEGSNWTGKIPGFFKYWPNEINNNAIYYCPYIYSSKAEIVISGRLKEWQEQQRIVNAPKILPTYRIGVSSCLGDSTAENVNEALPVAKLCVKYHQSFISDEHIEKGGESHYGFGGAGLTLVVHTNCPNNSLPIIWHGKNGWYPLFPRVDHHHG